MTEAEPRQGFWKHYGTRILAIAFSVAITVVVVLNADRMQEMQRLGYLGVFIVALAGNATVVLPVPSMAMTFASGSVLNPWLVGVVAGLGEPLGELTGYLAGYGGSAIIEESARYQRIKASLEKHAFLTLFILSAIPNPLFDLAGMAAGVLHYPVYKFLIACWLGKTLKALTVAFIGSISLGAVQQIFGL